jgi:DNA-binding NarL/FixJ family response regulator
MTDPPSRPPAVSPVPSRVLIVDDHPMMREGLSAILSSQPDLIACGEAANISDALEQVYATSPDVVIVDISLNGENGLELVRQIKSFNLSIRVLVLSLYDEGLYAECAVEAGAMGYLNKQVVSRQIVKAIRRILAGERYLSEEIEARIASRQARSSPSTDGSSASSPLH